MTTPKRRGPDRKIGTRRLHIPITQEIINNAVERDSAHCVIADAIQAALPEVTRVSVDLQTIRFTLPDGTRVLYLTPAPSQTLLTDFDQGRKPEPSVMYLSAPFQRVPPRKDHTDDDRPNHHAKRVEVKNRGGHGGVDVTVVGGNLPPTAALSNTRGRVRRFGVRQLRP